MCQNSNNLKNNLKNTCEISTGNDPRLNGLLDSIREKALKDGIIELETCLRKLRDYPVDISCGIHIRTKDLVPAGSVNSCSWLGGNIESLAKLQKRQVEQIVDLWESQMKKEMEG